MTERGADGAPGSGVAGLDDPDELLARDPGEWPALDPGALRALEARGVDASEVPDEALPTDRRCPRCHWPVVRETIIGPDTRVLGPCGCRL